VETREPLPPLRLLDVLHRPHFPNLTILREWARHPWQIAPTPALASIVGDGSLDLAFDALGGAESLDDSWTDATLYVCAVRQRDLHRVVFGRNVDAPLGSAVAASCAIPGYFKPVTIDGVDYLDGGVHSATNADLLRRAELDLVVVISPMSGRELPSWGLGPAIRRFARRNAMRELDRVRASGTPSLILEPDASSCSLMGTDFMSEERLSEVVAAAFLDTGQQLRARESAPLLRAIDVRSVA
jgi:NTE family protein